MNTRPILLKSPAQVARLDLLTTLKTGVDLRQCAGSIA